MKILLEHQQEISVRIKKSKGVSLFLDFDGTLSPIVPDFRKAALDPNVKISLEKAATKENVKITIISGRELSDLKSRVPIPNINFSGTHGLEWEINGKYNRYEFDPDMLLSLKNAKLMIEVLRKEFVGIEMEEKTISLALHYRNLENSLVNDFKNRFYSLAKESKIDVALKFVEGKKVIDLRPNVDWNKGKAAKMIHESFKDFLVIAMGDDTTDEDLFREFSEGITVKVGYDEKSNAGYYLDTVNETARFIDLVTDSLS